MKIDSELKYKIHKIHVSVDSMFIHSNAIMYIIVTNNLCSINAHIPLFQYDIK